MNSSPDMLGLQLIASAALVAVVFWYMWKLPDDGERFYGWAPALSLFSAWVGLIAAVLSIVIWWLNTPEVLVTILMLMLYPASLASGFLVQWIYRSAEPKDQAVDIHRLQAKIGIVLGIIGVVLGYIYVMTTKTPFTPVGM